VVSDDAWDTVSKARLEEHRVLDYVCFTTYSFLIVELSLEAGSKSRSTIGERDLDR
jgi:hypothetical protein